MRLLLYLLFAEVFLVGMFRAEPVFGQQTVAAVAAPHRPPWMPAETNENIPALEPGSTCDLDDVLRNSGDRILEFINNVERFTAREVLLQETINKEGKVSRTEQRKYDYLVSISEIRPGMLNVEEFLRGDPPDDFSGGITGMITKGLPTLVLIFHPKYSMDFTMKCEGLANFNGKSAWQVQFRQRPEQPNRIRTYRFGLHGRTYPTPLQGRAWFAADSYQILSLKADLIGTIPEIDLTVDHTTVEYGPVHFGRGEDMWLPKTAELYSDLKKKRIHQRMSFNEYYLFAVEANQKISVPKVSAE